MKRKDANEIRQETFKLFDEQMFCILYPILYSISKEYNDLSPAEVYNEAKELSRLLTTAPRPDMLEYEVKDNLEEKFAIFETKEENVSRSAEDIQRTTFLVLVTSMFLITAWGKLNHTMTCDAGCKMLAKMTHNHILLERFLSEVRKKEDEEELKGKRVEMINLMCQEEIENTDSVDDLINCALDYKDSVIENLLTVVSDINDHSNRKFDTQVEKLRNALKTRVQTQNNPRPSHVTLNHPKFEGPMYDVHGNSDVRIK